MGGFAFFVVILVERQCFIPNLYVPVSNNCSISLLPLMVLSTLSMLLDGKDEVRLNVKKIHREIPSMLVRECDTL